MADDEEGGILGTFRNWFGGGDEKDTDESEDQENPFARAAEAAKQATADAAQDDDGRGVFDMLSDAADVVGLGDAVDRAGEAVDDLIHGDADNDGLGNVEEVTRHGTNPFDSDTDDDFVSDGDEVRFGTNPRHATGDGTYVVDPVDPSHVPEEYKRAVEEHYANRDAGRSDSGGGDGAEEGGGIVDALSDMADYVGLGDTIDRAAEAVDEFVHGDADGDDLSDLEEVFLHGTDPTVADTDGDFLLDSWEVRSKGDEDESDPVKFDTDGDGLGDGVEVREFRTSPNKADTDGDGLDDGYEVIMNRSDPTDATKTEMYDWDEPDYEPSSSGAAASAPAPPSGDADVSEFLDLVAAQLGDRYRFGAEVDLNDADPDVFDCSELVQWAANRAGAEMPDGSWNQYKAMARAGGTVDVDEALNTPGALVFRFSSDPFATEGRPRSSHVAISLGDGRVIESNTTGGRGVQVNDGAGRFGYAAVVPEFADDTIEFDELQELFERHGIPPSPEDFHEDLRDDSERGDDEQGEEETPADQLDDVDLEDFPDDDPENIDSSDHDADFDGISNDQEIIGNVIAANNPIDSPIDSPIDRDRDGLTNEAEARLGTDPDNRDTDGDSIPDFTEVRIGTDPLASDTVLGIAESDGTADDDVDVGIVKADAIVRQQREQAEQERAEQERAEQSDEKQAVGGAIPEAPLVAELPEEEEEPPQAAVEPPVVPEVEIAEPVEEALPDDFFEEVDASIDSLTADFDEPATGQ